MARPLWQRRNNKKNKSSLIIGVPLKNKGIAGHLEMLAMTVALQIKQVSDDFIQFHFNWFVML